MSYFAKHRFRNSSKTSIFGHLKEIITSILVVTHFKIAV